MANPDALLRDIRRISWELGQGLEAMRKRDLASSIAGLLGLGWTVGDVAVFVKNILNAKYGGK